MCKEDTNVGQNVANKIRQVLLNADLRIVYAKGEIDCATADYELYSKGQTQREQKRALIAKTRIECYTRYISKVNNVKAQIKIALDDILSRYTPKYKEIWNMYFLEQASIQEISDKVHYCPRNVDKIVRQFKVELTNFDKETFYEKNSVK